jgi:RNA polymerase sigma factor (TIGR02999 family)
MNAQEITLNLLFPLVYEELIAAARRQLAGARAEETLGSRGLVHEAYLKLANGSRREWVDRRHVLAVATRAMRQIVVDHARARSARKRGGGAAMLVLDDPGHEAGSVVRMRPGAIDADRRLALAEALARLEAANERPARVVELRFYVGLSVQETAQAMHLSPRTVKREWRAARAFLCTALSGGVA